jgi:hypothetical protein
MTTGQENAVAALLSLVLVAGLVVLVRRLVTGRDTEVQATFPLVGPQAVAEIPQMLAPLPGVTIRPVGPGQFELVRRVSPDWTVAFLLLGIVGLIPMALIKTDMVTRAFVEQSPEGDLRLAVSGRLPRPHAARLPELLAPLGMLTPTHA